MYIDKVSIDRIMTLHPSIRNEVLSLYNHINENILTSKAKIRITEGLRSFEKQEQLYNKGNVTRAKAGQSFHNYGLAFDFCILIDKKEISWDINKDFDEDKISDWMEVVRIFKEKGYKWGGEFKNFDGPHFEKSFGYTWNELYDKYRKKEFIVGSEYIKL